MRGAVVLVALGVLVPVSGALAVTPGKARVELGIRKPKHFLGENILVDFCVVNTGTSPIQLDVGGDYRGSSRSLRFKLEVRDARGALAVDPDPEPYNLGGISYEPTIAPGKRWCQSLPLARYARIEKPGRYTITATHDLGWPPGKAPKGKATIELVMPTAAEAEQVVAAMEKLPDDPNTSAGDASIDYADWSALAYEPYLGPLEARARQGQVRALAGLAFIATPAATKVLVELLKHPDAKLARAAAHALAMRLPDPQLAGQLGARNPFENTLSEQRKHLTRAWVPALADDVRAAAKQRLASSDLQDQTDGAFMLQAVGLAADAPDLARALDAAIERTKTVPAEPGVYPVPRGAAMELLRAAQILVARGATAPAAPRSPGELALWLVAVQGGARPAGWEATLDRTLAHPIAYVRQLAMERAPLPLTASHTSALAKNLAHADPDVVVAAAELAQRAKLVALAPEVVQAMAKPTGLRLNIVASAAYMLGARHDRATMLVRRLADPAAFDTALGLLCDLLDYTGRSTSGQVTDAMRAAVIPAWQKLVADHRADIEAGKKLPLSHPSVTPALVPPTWKLGKPTGGQWP